MKLKFFKRRNSLLFAIIIGIVLMYGCTVLSFYPFYTKDVLKQDSRIEGKWIVLEKDDDNPGEGDTLIWEISDYVPNTNNPLKNDEEKDALDMREKYLYKMEVYDISLPDKAAEFDLYLFKVENQLYLDFYPEDWDVDNTILSFHLMPAHTLAKVSIADTLIINWLDIDWFKEMLDQNKIRIHHEQNRDYTLLTAKPEELQKFIQKYGKDKTAWEEGLSYKLIRNPS